ncbi:MAG: GWxTD domain-containing protein [Gemmatimonadetes bacterium]|nr:GWxTD domain-containing protein [Gemmatimonadota bacterium]
MILRRGIAGAPILIVGLAASGCGTPMSEPATPALLVASTVVPRLDDPLIVYRQLGFMVADSGVAFVASLRFLAGPSPDSTVALFGMSMANEALSFQRQLGAFEARYRVDLLVRREGRLSNQFSATELVRVFGYEETQREDESVIFQRVETLSPGVVEITVVVTDEITHRSTSIGTVVHVPVFGGPPTLSVVPIFVAAPRRDRHELPRILANPRSTGAFGADSLAFFLEAVGLEPGAAVRMRIRDARGTEMWADSVILRGSGEITAALVEIGPEFLPPGGYEMEATAEGISRAVRVPIVVVLPGLPAVSHLDEVLSLLRYFPIPERQSLRNEDEIEGARAWRQFWTGSDPNPDTPVNEALVEYFELLRLANARFTEAGQPGWLTDRGMVFITLGRPERIEQRTGFAAPVRMIRWRYRSESGDGVVLDFVGEEETGRFPLAPHSRGAYERLVSARRGGA